MPYGRCSQPLALHGESHRRSVLFDRAPRLSRFIRETCLRQGIDRGQLTIHADRGPAMTSKPVALLLADLSVTKTHARPHVSNDKPVSEAQVRTRKYRQTVATRVRPHQYLRAHGAVLV